MEVSRCFFFCIVKRKVFIVFLHVLMSLACFLKAGLVSVEVLLCCAVLVIGMTIYLGFAERSLESRKNENFTLKHQQKLLIIEMPKYTKHKKQTERQPLV